MREEYKEELIYQLQTTGKVIFIHYGSYYDVFLNSSCEYEYSIYEDFGEELRDGGVLECTARETIETLIEG